jgi:hypothetical protein
MTAAAHDGNVKWYWAPAVADLEAPDEAEIAAATLIPAITNYDTPASESEVDTSGVDDIYDTSVVGTSKAGPITLTIKRDDTSETNTRGLLQFRSTGFLIKSPFGEAETGSTVTVYPAQIGQIRDGGYSRNSVQDFQVSFYVTSPPEVDAVVVA